MKECYTLNILDYKNLYDYYFFMKSTNIKTHVLCKSTITNKAVKETIPFLSLLLIEYSVLHSVAKTRS